MATKTTKQPRVAVVVLNYNGRDLLDESLGSLSKQTYPNYKLYVADDGSIDDSIEFIKKNFPQVKVIKGPRNFGPAGITHYAVSRIKEEYVVLTSNDMDFDKRCVEVLVKTITSEPKVGICSAILVKNKKDKETGQYLIDNAGFDMDIFGFVVPRANNQSYKDYSKEIQEVFASCGGCFVTSKKIFKRAGGFDETFFGLSDDIDFSWRVRLLGYRIVVNPRAFLYHHISPTLGKIKRRKTRFMSERNILRMMLKNYSWWSFFKILPRYFLLETGEVIFYLVNWKPALAWSIIKALGWNLIYLSETLKLRRKIQKKRKVNDLVILDKLSHKSYKIKISIKGEAFGKRQ